MKAIVDSPIKGPSRWLQTFEWTFVWSSSDFVPANRVIRADHEQPPWFPYCPSYLLYLREDVAAVLLLFSSLGPVSYLLDGVTRRGHGKHGTAIKGTFFRNHFWKNIFQKSISESLQRFSVQRRLLVKWKLTWLDLCLFVVVTCSLVVQGEGALECLGWAGGVDYSTRGPWCPAGRSTMGPPASRCGRSPAPAPPRPGLPGTLEVTSSILTSDTPVMNTQYWEKGLLL